MTESKKIYLLLSILFSSASWASSSTFCSGLFRVEQNSNGSLLNSTSSVKYTFNPLLTASNIHEQKQAASRHMGVNKEMFGTTVYFQPIEKSEQLAGFPGVKKEARAIYLGFGGGGTRQSTGRTFARHGKVLDDYDVSMISIDYPYHGRNLGRNDQRFMNADIFMKHIIDVVDFYLKSGKPIVLFGHSFGSTVIKELLYRRPDIANGRKGQILGVFLTSPGGSITPNLMNHYRRNEATILAKAYADDYIDEVGGLWIDTVELGFKISDGRRVHHTVPIRIVSGDQDLLNTVPLLYDLRATLNPQATEVQVLPDVGHQIFYFRGDSHNLILETVLNFTKEALGLDELNTREDRMSRAKDIKIFAANSSLFRHWLQVHGKNLDSITRDWRAAKGAMKEWNLWYSNLLAAEAQKILRFMDKEDLETIDKNLLVRVRFALSSKIKDFTEQEQTDLGEFILFGQNQPGLKSRLEGYRTN